MARPTRWNPLHPDGRPDSGNELDDLAQSPGSGPISREYERLLQMQVHVSEDDKAYRVTVEVPGVKQEDFNVSVVGNQVSISVEFKREGSGDVEEERGGKRFNGKTFRWFSLRGHVDSSKADVRYDGGVLLLILPKLGVDS